MEADTPRITTVSNPAVPLTQNIFKREVILKLVLRENTTRFTINIQTPKGDEIAFQFDVRLRVENDQNVIVRNAFLDNKWGKEERDLGCDFPFFKKKKYSVKILVTHSDFEVFVDGYELLRFKKRVEPYKFDTLSVTGDVVVDEIIY